MNKHAHTIRRARNTLANAWTDRDRHRRELGRILSELPSRYRQADRGARIVLIAGTTMMLAIAVVSILN